MKVLLIVAGLFTACGAHADDLLVRVLQQLAEPPVLRARFVQQRLVDAISRPTVSRGRLTVSGREGILWQIESPVQVTFAFTPTQVIETGPDGLRRLHSPRGGAAQASIGRVMRGILGADAGELRAHFDATAEGSLERWSIRLAPKAREVTRFIKAIRLAGGRHLDAIDIEETSGDRTAIQLREFATAAALEPGEREQFTAP